ncbi:MAG: thioredoxin domain-containing protein [Deferribacteraceae bacterium]|jgi:glutaredoxin|nr:thioredoxin domain-containing protein [Deferribacteraceae bacterium]
MKKVLFALVLVCLFAGCSKLFKTNVEEADNSLTESIRQTIKARNIDADVEVKRLAKLDAPNGFYFYRVTIKDRDSGDSHEQYVFFDGKFIAPDFIKYENSLSLSKELQFDYNYTDIDTSNLSLLYGKSGAKNVIVKITDFECPYCRTANAYLENKLKGGEYDVAVYIIHFPLTSIHRKAELFAKVFEAGYIMKKNFSHELFSNEALLDMTDSDIITYFASKSENDAKFRELVYSDGVAQHIKDTVSQAQSHGINATPVIYINGKRIEGFDAGLIDKAISSFK